MLQSSRQEVIVRPTRHLQYVDLAYALRQGWRDFLAVPSSAILIALIYPLLGLAIARVLHGMAVLPMLFPLASGFALLGPFACLLFYDISRQRENGDVDVRLALTNVLNSRSLMAVVALGVILAIVFAVWISVSRSIYVSFYGYGPAAGMMDFVANALGTARGRTFLVETGLVGLLFAVMVFCLTVVSFPYLLDKHGSALDAALLSFRVTMNSPRVLAVWGLVIAAMLFIGFLPFFLGLAVVLPILGHASWHLYRRATS